MWTCSLSRQTGVGVRWLALMCLRTSHSKHLIMTGGSATRRLSLRLLMTGFWQWDDCGVHQAGWDDRLRQGQESCSAHSFSTCPVAPSELAACLGLRSVEIISCSCTMRVCLQETGVGDVSAAYASMQVKKESSSSDNRASASVTGFVIGDVLDVLPQPP